MPSVTLYPCGIGNDVRPFVKADRRAANLPEHLLQIFLEDDHEGVGVLGPKHEVGCVLCTSERVGLTVQPLPLVNTIDFLFREGQTRKRSEGRNSQSRKETWQ